MVTVVLFFVLAGCGITQIPYVSPAPPEKNCTLKIIGTLTVKQFDGQNVEWKPNGMDAWAAVQIAGGSHTFVVDYEESETQHHPGGSRRDASGNLYISFDRMETKTHFRKNIPVKYDHFIAGHTYELIAANEFEGSGCVSGLFSGGASGRFKNMMGSVGAGGSQAVRVGIRDVSNNQDGKIEWF
jgi:hypothetical protein